MGLLYCSQGYFQVLPQHTLLVSLFIRSPDFHSDIALLASGRANCTLTQGQWRGPVFGLGQSQHSIQGKVWFQSRGVLSLPPNMNKEALSPDYSDSHLRIPRMAEQAERNSFWCHHWAKAERQKHTEGFIPIKCSQKTWTRFVGARITHLWGRGKWAWLLECS